MPNNRRHVVPAGPGKWAVKEPGKATPNSSHRTQEAAERAAKQALEKVGGGEAVIHDRGGIYQYFGVPDRVHSGIMQAGSKGRYLASLVKDRYACQRVA